LSRWGKASQLRLTQLDPRLVEVMEFLRDFRDLQIVCTHRSPEDQLKAFNSGHSKVKVGKHNKLPSLAVDFQPYPVPTLERDLRETLSFMAGAAVAYGQLRGYRVRWGGDWNRNWDTSDNSFDDLYHLELVE
jgi:peptidoglycan L-alanyl-D-glutamate endopeptidase CwlK